MKTLLLLFLSCSFAMAQDGLIDKKEHRIVMQFSDGDSLSQASVTGQVKNIKTAWPNATVEVVCHGPGLDLLIAKKSKASQAVADWSAQGVTFSACNNTMKRRNVKKEELLPVSQVVPSAMIQIVKRQEEDWAYVKGGH